jgi:hypothetical protein
VIPGTQVRAKVRLAHPKPGEIATVIGMTPSGDVRLRLASTDYVPHARPEDLEIVRDASTDLDTEPF